MPRGRCRASAATRSSRRARASARCRRELGDKLRSLHGVELNIGPAGELDYDLEFRRSFDWCLASVHDHFDLDRAAQTRRIVTAMQDPAVRMIGHPSARMIGGRPPIDLDYDQVFAAAEATGTALEVNGGAAAPGSVGRGAAPRARARTSRSCSPATPTTRSSSNASTTPR